MQFFPALPPDSDIPLCMGLVFFQADIPANVCHCGKMWVPCFFYAPTITVVNDAGSSHRTASS